MKPSAAPHASLTHLQLLEAESIHIMREVVSEADKPVMLFSAGKDSSVMLHLALKAFFPAPPPFPLLHVDTTWKFRAMYEMRDRVAREHTLMWGRRLPEGDDPIMAKLCLECHREGSCGEKKTLGNYMHSLDVSVGITPEIKLPLYRAAGTQDPQGKGVCSTCHNSHQWDPGDPQKRGEEGTQSDSFLILTSSGNSPLCSECHPDKSHIQDTEHDLQVSATDEKNKQGALPGESGLCEQCHAVHNASIGAFIWNREVGPREPRHPGQVRHPRYSHADVVQGRRSGSH